MRMENIHKRYYPDYINHSFRGLDAVPVNNLNSQNPISMDAYSNARNDSQNSEPGFANRCCSGLLTAISYFLIVIFFPFSICVSVKIVQQYERAVIFRLGRLLSGGAKGPGLFFILPCLDNYMKVDLRTISYNIPPQEVLTKDSVTVAVDAVVFYRIHNATDSITNVNNVHTSTQLVAQTTLRNVLGIKNLSEILSDREALTQVMQGHLEEATDRWGVHVERVELKDVRLPMNMQRAMAAEAEATREAKAKIIAAEGEQKASLALKQASDVLSQSPAALQLRYLQTLNQVADEKNSTIIFPLPMEILAAFSHDKKFY